MMKRWIGILVLAGGLQAGPSVVAQSPPPSGGPAPALPTAPGPAVPNGGAVPPPGWQPGQPMPGPNGMPPANSLPPGMPAPFCAPPPPVCAEPPKEQVPIDLAPKPAGCLLWSFGVEYLQWWINKPNVPPLLTVGNPNDFQVGVPGAIPGALGQPGTHTLFQQFAGDYDHSGLRLSSEVWFDPGEVLGLQGNWWILNQQDPKFSAGGDGGAISQLIARPFFNVNTNLEDADPVNTPGVQSGHIMFSSPRYLMGGEANLCYNYLLDTLSGFRLALLAGGRFMLLDEKLLISETTTQLPDVFGNPGPTDVIGENFTCYNRFYGGQLGGQMEFLLGPVYVQTIAKIAYGNTNQVVEISGSTVQTNPPNPFFNLPATTVSNTALLVQPSNSGRFTRNESSWVPEGQLNLGYAFNDNFMIRGGYTGMYWTNVVRPGNEINTNVNLQPLGSPVQIGPAAPIFAFRPTNLWIQGIQVGLEISF